VDETPDYGSTTAVVARVVRKHLTPATVWGAIGTLTLAIGYVLNAQHDLARLKESMAESKRTVADLQQQLAALPKNDTQMAVLSGKVDAFGDEVDRLREWRDRIEGIAETPPHARRRALK
jgi:cob(I)alamin adenosyltransferase